MTVEELIGRSKLCCLEALKNEPKEYGPLKAEITVTDGVSRILVLIKIFLVRTKRPYSTFRVLESVGYGKTVDEACDSAWKWVPRVASSMINGLIEDQWYEHDPQR